MKECNNKRKNMMALSLTNSYKSMRDGFITEMLDFIV